MREILLRMFCNEYQNHHWGGGGYASASIFTENLIVCCISWKTVIVRKIVRSSLFQLLISLRKPPTTFFRSISVFLSYWSSLPYTFNTGSFLTVRRQPWVRSHPHQQLSFLSSAQMFLILKIFGNIIKKLTKEVIKMTDFYPSWKSEITIVIYSVFGV